VGKVRDSRLIKGDHIRLIEDGPGAPEREIEYPGLASIKIKNRMKPVAWEDRGITWTSDKLDRMDRTKGEFTKAATGGEGSERTT
jgi:hypothetical protein